MIEDARRRVLIRQIKKPFGLSCCSFLLLPSRSLPTHRPLRHIVMFSNSATVPIYTKLWRGYAIEKIEQFQVLVDGQKSGIGIIADTVKEPEATERSQQISSHFDLTPDQLPWSITLINYPDQLLHMHYSHYRKIVINPLNLRGCYSSGMITPLSIFDESCLDDQERTFYKGD